MSETAFPRSPIRDLLGLRLIERRPGFVRLGYQQLPEHLNYSGILHGGILMTLLDEAGGVAGSMTETPGEYRRSITVTMSVSFTGQVEDPALEATGEVVRSGRSLYFARSEVRDGRGNLLAFGSSTHRYRQGG